MRWVRWVPKDPWGPPVPKEPVRMEPQHWEPPEPSEQRVWLGQRARLELPVPKEQKARRAQQVEWQRWGYCWRRGHRQAWVPWGIQRWW